MEGWNGEDENSVPTVNVSLCCYSRFCMGFEGSYIQKLVWFHCNGQNLRILQTSMDIYTLQDTEAAPAPWLVTYTKTFINCSSSRPNSPSKRTTRMTDDILSHDMAVPTSFFDSFKLIRYIHLSDKRDTFNAFGH